MIRSIKEVIDFDSPTCLQVDRFICSQSFFQLFISFYSKLIIFISDPVYHQSVSISTILVLLTSDFSLLNI